MKQSKNKIYTDTYFYTKLRVVAAELRGCLRKQARIQIDFEPVEVCPLLYTTRISCTKMLIELEKWDSVVKVLDSLLGKTTKWLKHGTCSPGSTS